MAYETFERGFVRTGSPGMTVRPDGRFFFNAAASAVLRRSGVKAVRILWDSEKKKVAFQACEKGDKNAYSITFPKEGRSPGLTAKSFVRHIGWSAEARERVAVTWDEGNKMLEATLPAKFLSVRRKAMKADE